ncbi:hypothetical protein JXA12_03055 [Candidatus Woesearchaeota archaeon]|nr:hypothetical protein [Candidatus Woesearchaeota archaeon]
MRVDDELERFKRRYADRLSSELGDKSSQRSSSGIQTQDYDNFRKQYLPRRLSWYEKACNASEKLFRISPDKKKLPEIEEAIDICHLKVTPAGVTSFSFLVPVFIIVLSLLLGWMLPYALTSGEYTGFFFVIFGLLVAASVAIPLQKLPFFLANSWRLKASNQMVLCVFYVVTYMRHTSNLELAIDFAAEHLSPPLSIDLKKIIWNIETEKYDSVKESLDNYLMSWRNWNMEFIESMHLIESSLYESSESRRVNALDKSLKVMLDETYEKMLHYAHNLKSPLTTLHMLGIIMPILGLVIMPLVVSFMSNVRWYHLFVLYNVVLPLGVYYLGKNILSTRPTGYGESDISEANPAFKKYRNIIIRVGKEEVRLNPAFVAVFVFAVLFLIGITPLLLWASWGECGDYVVAEDSYRSTSIMNRCDLGKDQQVKFSLLDYRDELEDKDGSKVRTGGKIGPYGLGAALLSLTVPLAFGVGGGLWYRLRSKNVIKIRKKAKKLEQEFATALFQLGNRLGDGYPSEIAFQKVAEVMEGTISGKFFELVSMNIQKNGMGVEKAIFDPHKGALVYYPSNLIESSMKVLIESSKKGPLIASQAVINVSEYIKQMHRVDERLRDLMADIISSMVSQIKFLTPAIAGIVVGITSMITQILGNLTNSLNEVTGEAGAESSIGMSGAGFISSFGAGVPTFYFQIIVGLYVVQIVYILTVLVNGIQNGADKLNERYLLGNNLIKSTTTYVIIAFVIMLLFSLVAGALTSVT